ncbi:ferredoxin [Nocardia sp. NPDC002869]|uniref:ferredoxin n=1 Tax=Nocardia sp. NPDC002869 TaxID=3161032 RepID=UPI00398C8F73
MALNLTVDLARCTGCACCMMECPDLFDIDNDSGKAVLLEPRPTAERLDEAVRAVRSCPEGAIRLEEK